MSSTDYIFLAPRSARRSDASNAAGRSAGGSLWRQGSLAGSGARAFKRLWRTRNRAGIGTSLRAPPTARTPQTQPGGRRAEADGAIGRLQAAALARTNACGTRAAVLASAPRCALRASLGRHRRSRAVGGRKHAAPQAACQAAAPARSNASWQWSSAKEPSADARSRARCSARTIVRGRDAPALPCHSACGAHLGPRPPKQPVWRVRTPPRMGEEAPSRRALDHPHQPAARPECPSARPASRPPRHALDQRPAYGRESPARSHGNPMTRAQR
jgi:hypothetical protein